MVHMENSIILCNLDVEFEQNTHNVPKVGSNIHSIYVENSTEDDDKANKIKCQFSFYFSLVFWTLCWNYENVNLKISR